MVLKFCVPDGNDKYDVDPVDIEKAILRGTTEFWEAGSGDASVRFEEKDEAEGEIILMVRPFGVFVQFTERESGKELVLTKGDGDETVITIEQGGEPWEIPRKFFVSPTLAARAVMEFAQTGKRPRNKKWSEY